MYERCIAETIHHSFLSPPIQAYTFDVLVLFDVLFVSQTYKKQL